MFFFFLQVIINTEIKIIVFLYEKHQKYSTLYIMISVIALSSADGSSATKMTPDIQNTV